MNLRFYKKLFVLSAFIIFGLVLYFGSVHPVLAQTNTAGEALGLNTEFQQTTGLGNEDIRVTIAKIIRVALGLLGIVAVVLIVYAGYVWMTAGGNDENIESAKKILRNAVIGLIIILSAYSIVSFIISKLLEATTGKPAHCFNGIQDADETAVDVGGACGYDVGGGGGDVLNRSLYITVLPSPGDACVANFHPVIFFNKAVDITSFVTSSIYIEYVDKTKGDKAFGTWQYLTPNNHTAVKFVPNGQCVPFPDATRDCFNANTDYKLNIVSNPLTNTGDIVSEPDAQLGVLPLRCDLGRKCGPVPFKTGNLIDEKNPTVTIAGPNTLLEAGKTVPVAVDFTDDAGVRSIVLSKLGRMFNAGGYKFINGRNLAVGDFNSDGNQDVAVGFYGNSGSLYFGDGTGKFGSTPGALNFGSILGSQILAADFNNDKILDLARFNRFSNKLFTIILGNGLNGKGDGTFRTAIATNVPYFVSGVTAADLNKDGKVDLVLSARHGTKAESYASVFLGKGDGTFQAGLDYIYGTSSGDVVVGDVNKDGNPDIVISDQLSKNISVLIGKGDGTFNNPTVGLVVPANGTVALALGDLNNDGKADLVSGYTNPGKNISVAFGNGNGTFAAPKLYPSAGMGSSRVIVADFNNDGFFDIAATGDYNNNFSILYNKGDGTFLLPDTYPLATNAGDLVISKFNGDNLFDIATLAVATNTSQFGLSIFLGTQPQQINSTALEGCQTSGRVSIPWGTKLSDVGNFTLNAVGVDVSAKSAVDLHGFSILPPTCFNSVLDAGEDQKGPPACSNNGLVCGQCAGTSCSVNSQCITGLCVNGVCQEKPQITDFTPKSAGKDSFVTVKGYFFGNSAGSVYFALKNNPDPNNNADWKPATVVSCGGYSGWTNRQIIVQVPDGIVQSGPIRVVTRATNSVPSQIDTTAMEGLPNFTFTNERLPGICAILPTLLNGQAGGGVGKNVRIIGKGFDQLNSNDDFVLFGGLLKSAVNQNTWTSEEIPTVVPNLDAGYVGVTVSVNGKNSNSFEFEVLNTAEIGGPIITNITPTSGPHGQYITIEGSGFGSEVGQVWFKDAVNSDALDPSEVFDFPPGICDPSNYWQDNRIIAKFPKTAGSIGTSYFVQVKPASNKNPSTPDPKYKFLLTNGVPTPGLCKLDPPSGAVPFVLPQKATLQGEYFTNDTNIYFAKNGQTTNPTTGALATRTSWTQNKIEVLPTDKTITGRVVAYRASDKAVSNPLQFAAVDCTTQGNQCGLNTQRCCTAGPDKGFCKDKNQLCAGEKRSTGYIWRFSTKDMPEIPHVVERCDDDGIILNPTIPSPSPNIRSQEIWGLPKSDPATDPQYNVCRTAISFVEFSMPINGDSIRDNLQVYRCSSVNSDGQCTNWVGDVKLDPSSYILAPGTESHPVLAIQPEANAKGAKQWLDNTWYQVVLTRGIRSSATAGNSATLAIDQPCDGNGISNSAYCYKFKTDNQDCHLRAVVITPYSYFTTYLESPMLDHGATGLPGQPVPYKGNGLSTQRCVMMDVSNYDWNWSAEKPNNVVYADIHDGANLQTAHVSSIANTINQVPNDKVNISATASLVNEEPKTGNSPLKIDLSKPEVLEAWPTCLEACTDAEVGVRFNMTMNETNLPGAPAGGPVQLLECLDENCLSTRSVFVDKDVAMSAVHLDPSSNYTVLKILNDSKNQVANPALKPNTKYQVVLSVVSAPGNDSLSNQIWASYKFGDPSISNKGTKYNKVYTYTFKTKSEACKIDRVEVLPENFFAANINDRSLYSVVPYSAPDACSASGQKLNPWKVNWNWSTFVDRPNVATVQQFSTKQQNPNCTAQCLRKGSDIPFNNTNPIAICGNGKVEAGEDCDFPNAAKRCGLDCRYMGSLDKTCGDGQLTRENDYVKSGYGEQCDPKDPTSMVNCSADCRHLGSDKVPNPNNPNLSICGNGLVNGKVGNGEDCDLGVTPDPLRPNDNPLSSVGCSDRCLHLGTKLAKRWCQMTRSAGGYAGFTQTQFDAACSNALSICGDGFTDDDEDTGCDPAGISFDPPRCDNRCLIIGGDSPSDKANGNDCVIGGTPSEGCSADNQHTGSSVIYNTPSVCGDGYVGTGEDATCETGLTGTALQYNPFALAVGIGRGAVDNTKTPPAQWTKVIAATNQNTRNNATVSGGGNYVIQCGYKNESDCTSLNPSYGLGADSCCYARPQLVSTFPVTSTPIQHDVCPNTYLSATFNDKIDPSTLPGNILIATASDSDCVDGAVDVYDDVTAQGSQIVQVNNQNSSRLTWYQVVYQKISGFVQSLLGSNANAITYQSPTRWCVGRDVGTPSVEAVAGSVSSTRLVIKLDKPLAFDSNYAVIIKPGLKNTLGVSMATIPKNWKFNTANRLCEVNSVTVNPPAVAFSRAGEKSTLTALGANVTLQGKVNYIQSIPGWYAWNFIWGPVSNNIVTFSTTTSDATTELTAQNRNGELDVRAAANVYQNTISASRGIVATDSSHITVFLCENPWPPKSQMVAGAGPFIIFPYEDKAGNNDDYDPVLKQFNNLPIPQTEFLSGVGKDGYFNFRTYYCADAGGTGTADDLPFVSSVAQTSTKALAVLPSTCGLSGIDLNGGVCSNDNDCGYIFTTTTQQFVGDTTSFCASVTTSLYTYYVKNNQALSCSNAQQCVGNSGFNAWKQGQDGSVACVSMPANFEKNKCYQHRPLKRFFFTSNKSADTIGLQIFENRNFLTAEQWFKGDAAFGGQGFAGNLTKTKIDGYNAVTDGNNYYIEGLNYTKYGDLFGTIYLLSINSDAKAETRKVFDLMRDNLSLNTNLTNYGYCGTTIDNPGFVTQCKTDLDCPGSQVCSVQKDKLQRLYIRLRDAQTFENILQRYYFQTGGYPVLSSGSFLTGQTVSTWPQSWTLLSTQTQAIPPLPVDPINQLDLAGSCASNTAKFCTSDEQCGFKPKPDDNIKDSCVLHDLSTGWSVADRRFSFACATTSLAYRYIYNKFTKNYELRMNLEDFGKPISNLSSISKIFDPFSKLKVQSNLGICTDQAEISTVEAGYCGDGVINVNLGESCDPKSNSTRYGSCLKINNKDQIKVDYCTNNCQWAASTTRDQALPQGTNSDPGYILCKSLSVCGNGVKEFGEVCDQGPLNGTFNSCNSNCSGNTNQCGNNSLDSGELCEITAYPNSTKKGWCIGGVNNSLPCNTLQDCNVKGTAQSNAGVCVSTAVQGVKYAVNQNDSCNFDCRSRGPYCGDGVVQVEFGEECDGDDNSCKISGISGKRTCDATCHFVDSGASVWLRFKDVLTDAGNTVFENSANKNLNAFCSGNACPKFGLTDGKFDGAVTFASNQSMNLIIPNSNLISTSSSFSLAFWINPSEYDANKANRVLEKGGFNVGAGYTFDILNGLPLFSVWKDKTNSVSTVTGTSRIPTDRWSFVVATYEKRADGAQTTQALKIYVNGILVSEKAPVVNAPDWVGKGTANLIIGADGALSQNYYYYGAFDEFRYYDHALQPAEVVELFGNPWMCNAKLSSTLSANETAFCGDGIVNANEACDKGGDNSKVCVPSYNQSCTYCTKDCLVATVEPKEFCGNGIIEASEKCDTDPISPNTIYSLDLSITSTVANAGKVSGHNGYQVVSCDVENQQRPMNSSYQKGTKVCQSCQNIINKETGTTGCIPCGIVADGEEIGGGIINALSPNFNNPLLGSNLDGLVGTLDDHLPSLLLSQVVNNKERIFAGRMWSNESGNNYSLTPVENINITQLINSTEKAQINPNPICSYPNSPYYRMIINLDISRLFSGTNWTYVDIPFEVSADPKNQRPWRYDLVLSPSIPKNGYASANPPFNRFFNFDNRSEFKSDFSANTGNTPASATMRPGDIRFVVSWRGEGSLVGGFVLPLDTGTIVLEQNQLTPSYGQFYYNFIKGSTAINPSTNAQIMPSIWYHGRGDSDNQTHEISFTVDTLSSIITKSMLTSQYGFFVRTADNSAISSYRLRDVKVEIYYPDEATGAYSFGKPSKTIEFQNVFNSNIAISNNPRAAYWHVANIKSYVNPLNQNPFEPDILKRVVAPKDVLPPYAETPDGRIVTSASEVRF